MNTHSIGIDFGTTKTLVSHLNPQTQTAETLRLGRGTDYIPTTVFIENTGNMLFGDDADDMIEDTGGLYLRGFKMQLGSDTPLHMYTDATGEFRMPTAKDIVAAYLRYIKNQVEDLAYMGEKVTSAVITRPVNFSAAQLDELKQAALQAGFAQVDFTTEPEAAGLAFCRLQATNAFKSNALIVDWGGGTLDMALVSRDGDTVHTHRNFTDGDITMGGEAFDARLWEFTESQLKQQGISLNHVTMLPKVRKGKEQLSSRDKVTLRLSHAAGACPPLTLERTSFYRLISGDVDKATAKVKKLLEKIPTSQKPEMLILVGGSSHIPLIKEKLESACNLPARQWINSREAVALGAALSLYGLNTGGDNNQPAEEQSDAQSQYDLGCNYYNGQGVDQNFAKAVYWYQKAAEQGHADAQSDLGDCYYLGIGVAQDYAKAVYWYQKAAEQGHADAQCRLGIYYEHGVGVAQDYVQAVYWCRKAAEQGDDLAQCHLGKYYYSGAGVAQDYARAVYWYRKAAEQGDADAQWRLGFCYEEGKGVMKDFVKGIYWYLKAAEQGHAGAQCSLGNYYVGGQGVSQNYEQAVYWYQKAAVQDNDEAQFNLGICYENGLGITQNYAMAVYLYQKAAEQGHVAAKNNLGECYYKGIVVKQNLGQAVYLFQQAADQGYDCAQYNLGECYYQGQGVDKNIDFARHWFQKAAEQGHTKAKEKLNTLISEIKNVKIISDFLNAVRNGQLGMAMRCMDAGIDRGTLLHAYYSTNNDSMRKLISKYILGTEQTSHENNDFLNAVRNLQLGVAMRYMDNGVDKETLLCAYYITNDNTMKKLISKYL